MKYNLLGIVFFGSSVLVNAVGPIENEKESKKNNQHAVSIATKVILSTVQNPEFDFGSASQGAHYYPYVGSENNELNCTQPSDSRGTKKTDDTITVSVSGCSVS
ncbi:MAG TPA: hypothetical protein VHO47_04145 [Candidatus Babeliales bacterium]|nr:hypothetical protein [Candidatus Babeliales bacterium]